MIKFLKRIPWKDVLVTVLVVALGVGAIVGVGAAITNKQKTVSPLVFERGGVDENGEHIKSTQSIYTKDYIECQGLEITPDFEASGTYQVFYPNSYILFMTSFDTYNNVEATNRDGVYYCDFAEAIINVCEKYEVDCLDIYHNMPFDRDKDTVDGTHPTQEYIDQVWSPMIANFIRENYKK